MFIFIQAIDLVPTADYFGVFLLSDARTGYP
jgi:hypothetical protein